MTSIIRGTARYIALPVVCIGIIGGGALGSAGLATAATADLPGGKTCGRGTAGVTRHEVVPRNCDTKFCLGLWDRHTLRACP